MRRPQFSLSDERMGSGYLSAEMKYVQMKMYKSDFFIYRIETFGLELN